MSGAALDLCLGLAVAAVWLGCFGAMRLRRSLDRLHAVTFINAAAGTPVAIAAFLADGVSTRSIKLAVLVGFLLVSGAAISHAAGRALALRDGPHA